jgi:hypothetical protein
LARLPDELVERLASLPQTGAGYWIVVLRLWDGRELGGIGIIDGEMIDPPYPISTGEIAAIGVDTGEWIEASPR